MLPNAELERVGRLGCFQETTACLGAEYHVVELGDCTKLGPFDSTHKSDISNQEPGRRLTTTWVGGVARAGEWSGVTPGLGE